MSTCPMDGRSSIGWWRCGDEVEGQAKPGWPSHPQVLDQRQCYTVAECRLPHARYPITRPGATQPFAYAKDRCEVIALITQDSTATAE